mmetsp:Transcript_28973/g.54437  ORF Transcript_28973/g.54437 Transcript_28973/m.54437 type:complete len:158 (+) Transcript_28973:3-476(+)
MGFRVCNNNGDAIKTLECAIQKVSHGQFRHHQIPQANFIRGTLGALDNHNNINNTVGVGVTLVSYEQATSSILRELGGKPEAKKLRNRQDPTYTTTRIATKRLVANSTSGNSTATAFCQLKADSLPAHLVQEICRVYQADVQIMAWANLRSKHCPTT